MKAVYYYINYIYLNNNNNKGVDKLEFCYFFKFSLAFLKISMFKSGGVFSELFLTIC